LPGDFGEEPLDEVVREANNARSCASNRAYTAMKSSDQTLPAWRKNRPRKTTFTKAAERTVLLAARIMTARLRLVGIILQ
jgi:hypothetical protein